MALGKLNDMFDVAPASVRGTSYGRVIKALVIAVWGLLMFSIFHYSFQYIGKDVSISGLTEYVSGKQYKEPASLQDFSETWAETSYTGAFDGETLEKLCNHTKWRKDVVLQMNGANGGLANIRAEALDFLYLATHFGAPIIMPAFIERNPIDISDTVRDGVANITFSHFFDEDLFLSKMSQHCPQMTIYPTVEDAPITNKLKERFVPGPARHYRFIRDHFESRLDELRQWIKKQEDHQAGNISLIDVQHTYFNYDMAPLPKKRRMFGSLVQNRPDVRLYAGKAIHALHRLVNSTVPLYPEDTIHPDFFFGLHLRTDDDVKQWWGADGGFARQSADVIKLAKARGTKVMYVASGKLEHVRQLAVQAKEEAGIQVFCKDDLLDAEDLTVMHAMGFDLVAEIDFEVLSRASFFVGPSLSSFTWNIMLRRYHYNVENPLRHDNPRGIQETTDGAVWDDGLSRIIERGLLYGDYEMEYFGPDMMFP